MIDLRGRWDRARLGLSDAARVALSRRALPVWIAGGALAAALVALVAVGGLDEVPNVPDEVAVGDEVVLPTHTVTVLDAEFTDAVEDESLEADPGEVLLVVTLRLENLTDRTVAVETSSDRISSRLLNATESLLDLSGATPTGSADVWLEDGSAGIVLLQPGVPAVVRVAWAIPESEARDGVALDVYKARVRHGQIIIGSDVITWMRDGLVASVDLGRPV